MMSATALPAISPDVLRTKVQQTLAAELEWLLCKLQEDLVSLKNGLQECIALLAPVEPGSTLALSSLRSETVKGIVTRTGTRITKGDIQLRLATLPPLRNTPSFPLHISSDIALPQLSHVLTLLNQALDIIDISRWTGDPRNGPFIFGQLKLLQDVVKEARVSLKQADESSQSAWWQVTPDEQHAYTPAIPPTLSAHFSISDAAVVLHVRTLQALTSVSPTRLNASGATTTANSGPTLPDFSSWSGLSIRSRLGLALGKLPIHDELEQDFSYGNDQVRVKEKVRVESQDPSLIAVMAKLGALTHEVTAWKTKVGIVMGEECSDNEE